MGVISTPDGTHIEILPKILESDQDNKESRLLLFRMLSAVPELPFIETNDASLTLFNKPLIEPLIAIFLKKLANVVRQGIRKDYQRVEAEERFLKGQLQMALQIRQPIGRQHFFQIAYDVFSDNRAENRLIHAALLNVAKWSKDENNQKLARELRFAFNEIPVSINHTADFSCWKNSRDMVNYQPILPWVKLILNQQSPFSLKDQNAGISFLFPMEKLFEQYVAKMLTKQLARMGLFVKSQLSSKYLAENPKAFLLKPDLAVFENINDKNPVAILDTKWKLIDESKIYENGVNDPKSSISQSDMYQMFAYGHKYLGGKGKLVLIYPAWEKFNSQMTGLHPFQ